MKLPAFAYARPDSVDAALALLADDSRDSRILAGGQSLLAAMNFRLSSPDLLIDINRIDTLAGIDHTDGVIRIGALTRHAEVMASPLVAAELPLLARAIRDVAHPAIRNRGTFGGSVALADPAAEMPAIALACGATLVARSTRGERRIHADDYFLGLYETALRSDELLIAAEFAPHGARPWAFAEQARRRGDYASAGVAILLDDAHPNAPARVALFGVADRALRSPAAERPLAGGAPDAAAIADAAEHVCDGIDVFGDAHASAPMKRHLCRVLTRRALHAMTARAEP
ncbi:MAG: FAD binding domain-containing protein [Burkholderiaceae bacterium]